jgi:hypothetical protein
MNKGRATWRWIGSAAGLTLFVLAVWFALREREAIGHALDTVRRRPLLLAGLILLPCINWLLSSLTLWMLTRACAGPGRASVPLGDMTAAVGAAWLLNYIPVRPGLFGRIALQRVVHGVPVGVSVRATLISAALGVLAVIVFMLVAVAAARLGTEGGVSTAGAAALILLPAILAAAGALVMRGRVMTSAALGALSVRFLDMVVWMGRYALAFAAVGHGLTLSQTAAVAAVSQAAMLAPIAGNGLGVREWVIRLAGPALPAWLAAGATLTSGASLAADVVNRGCEIAASLVVGLACAAWLSGRGLRARGAGEKGEKDMGGVGGAGG